MSLSPSFSPSDATRKRENFLSPLLVIFTLSAAKFGAHLINPTERAGPVNPLTLSLFTCAPFADHGPLFVSSSGTTGKFALVSFAPKSKGESLVIETELNFTCQLFGTIQTQLVLFVSFLSTFVEVNSQLGRMKDKQTDGETSEDRTRRSIWPRLALTADKTWMITTPVRYQRRSSRSGSPCRGCCCCCCFTSFITYPFLLLPPLRVFLLVLLLLLLCSPSPSNVCWLGWWCSWQDHDDDHHYSH